MPAIRMKISKITTAFQQMTPLSISSIVLKDHHTFCWWRNPLRRKRRASTLLRHTTLSDRVIEGMFAAEIWLVFNQGIEALIELLSVTLKHGVYICILHFWRLLDLSLTDTVAKSVHQGFL